MQHIQQNDLYIQTIEKQHKGTDKMNSKHQLDLMPIYSFLTFLIPSDKHSKTMPCIDCKKKNDYIFGKLHHHGMSNTHCIDITQQLLQFFRCILFIHIPKTFLVQ